MTAARLKKGILRFWAVCSAIWVAIILWFLFVESALGDDVDLLIMLAIGFPAAAFGLIHAGFWIFAGFKSDI